MVATAATSVLLGLLGCRAPRTTPGPTPDVLLVTIEAVRADHVGVFGSALGSTPALDRLAAQGEAYSRAYASAPQTLPSHATILTGRLPPSHGVRDDGDFVLGEDQITLAESFRERGYTTLAVTSSFPTERRWGLSQGFDLYHDRQDVDEAFGDALQRRADDVVDDAIAAFVGASPERPVFTWVHLSDPHWPYHPPEPWEDEFPGRPYDAEIAFADAELGRLLAAWDARFDPATSIVVVTAPTGEALGEGGERTHGFLLTDATIRIPLVLRAPGVVPGTVTSDPVGHADIAPTLHALASLPMHEHLQGRDLRGGGSPSIYSEALTGQFNLGLAPLYALTDPMGRYVEGGWGAFYPAKGDVVGHEGTRLRSDGPNGVRLRAMREQLGTTLAPEATLDPAALGMLSAIGYVGGNPSADPGTIDPRDVIDAIPLAWQARRMMGVGMTGQAQSAVTELERLMPDTFGARLLEAQLLYHQGRLAEAENTWAGLYDAAPSATVALQLGSLTGNLDRWEEALAWFERAGELDPDSPEAMAGRARAHYQLGRRELAEELMFRFLAVRSDHGELSPIRSELLLDELQPQAAREEVERGLQYEPWSPWAHAAQARVFWELGRPDDAIDELQQALALDPYPVAIRLRLVHYLLDVGRNVDAVRVAAPLSRLVPDDDEAQIVYAQARAALTEDEWHDIRVDRARGP